MEYSRTDTDLIIVGGGAASFFAALETAKKNPKLRILILEQGNEVLGKVKISGGGRCNVTHACFDVNELIKFYPRGQKELRSAFHVFNCEHTVQWFKEKGVKLKTETDGRIFPTSDNSQTIIDCFLQQTRQHNIQIIKQAKVTQIDFKPVFTVHFNNRKMTAPKILIATGSNNSIWNLMQKAGHSIVTPVPSLFTFNIKSELIKGLEGISFQKVKVQLQNSKISTEGDLLITHTGLSGPAILKLSAFAARLLHAQNYSFAIDINWLNLPYETIMMQLNTAKEQQYKKQVNNFSVFNFPNRFWLKVITSIGVSPQKNVADLSKKDLQNLAQILSKSTFQVHSKNTNKDEFVTAGGINLKEINFKTMESKLIPKLYFAGEVLDIDAVTGGFNFQAAWTTGFIAAQSMASE